MGKLSDFDLRHFVGSVLFWCLIFVIIADPSNGLLHKKEVFFVLTFAYNAVVFKPDLSKLPYIIALFVALTVPWLFSMMAMRVIEGDEVFAVYKAIAPSVLLLWVREYDLVKLSRIPVVVCSIILIFLFYLVTTYPVLEEVIYPYCYKYGEALQVSRRYIFGREFFCMHLPSCTTFIFALTFYFYCLFTKSLRGFWKMVALVLITVYLTFMSGTRSTVLLSLFSFSIVGYISLKDNPRVKRFLYPIIITAGVFFVFAIIMLASDTREASNIVKYGHIASYAKLFEENPEYLIFGQGPGSTFYSDGFNKIVVKTEWSYLDLVRYCGVFAILVVVVFWKPLVNLWRHRNEHKFVHCMFWAYLAFLLIAGTNPLILSSTGIVMLLMAYSFESMVVDGKLAKDNKTYGEANHE